MRQVEAIDEAEVARARAGDETAFRALVERHSRTVFRVAFRVTGNEQDGEDVVTETFLKAYRRLGQFESRAQFGSWVYRIAANCAVDLLRSRARRDETPLEHASDDAEAGEPLPVTGDAPAQDRVVFSGEVRRRMAS